MQRREVIASLAAGLFTTSLLPNKAEAKEDEDNFKGFVVVDLNVGLTPAAKVPAVVERLAQPMREKLDPLGFRLIMVPQRQQETKISIYNLTGEPLELMEMVPEEFKLVKKNKFKLARNN